MARTTFQGPVRSLTGLFTQGPGSVVTNAATTLTLDPDIHGGRVLYNTATTTTITLPIVNATADANGTGPGSDPNTLNNQGVTYTIFIAANAVAVKIKCGGSGTPGDLFVGSLVTGKDGVLIAGGMAVWVPGAADDVINMNGSTLGGLVGSYLTLQAIAGNKVMVTGLLLGSSTLATPFATA